MYISKGMPKGLGCILYIRCALSIEKYGNWRKMGVTQLRKSNILKLYRRELRKGDNR
jgi:hypothetical protein